MSTWKCPKNTGSVASMNGKSLFAGQETCQLLGHQLSRFDRFDIVFTRACALRLYGVAMNPRSRLRTEQTHTLSWLCCIYSLWRLGDLVIADMRRGQCVYTIFNTTHFPDYECNSISSFPIITHDTIRLFFNRYGTFKWEKEHLVYPGGGARHFELVCCNRLKISFKELPLIRYCTEPSEKREQYSTQESSVRICSSRKFYSGICFFPMEFQVRTQINYFLFRSL